MRRLLALVLYAFIIAGPAHAASELRIVVLDVGQGDSIFLRTPSGKTVLVDAGGTPGWSKLSYEPGRDKLMPFLRREKVKSIDYAVISHPHGDHIGGFIELFRNLPVRTLVDPGLEHDEPEYPLLLKLAREKKTDYQVIGGGDTLDWDPALEVRVLGPPREFAYTGLNDNSVVLKITFKKVSILLTGDIEKEAEARLVRKYKSELQSQILKVPHHGSRTSSTPRFIDSVKPEVAVISCGRKNLFGHPHMETVSRLQARAVKVYQTDLDGDVEIRTNGKTYDITVQYNEP